MRMKILGKTPKKTEKKEKMAVQNMDTLLPDIPDIDPDLPYSIKAKLLDFYDKCTIKHIPLPKKYENKKVKQNSQSSIV